jgi:hypothetical protein
MQFIHKTQYFVTKATNLISQTKYGNSKKQLYLEGALFLDRVPVPAATTSKRKAIRVEPDDRHSNYQGKC